MSSIFYFSSVSKEYYSTQAINGYIETLQKDNINKKIGDGARLRSPVVKNIGLRPLFPFYYFPSTISLALFRLRAIA